MDWLVGFRDTTLPGTAATDDLHTGPANSTILPLADGGGFDAHGTADVAVRPFSLSKKIRATSAALYDRLRALIGKRGYLWRGRIVSSGVPSGAAFYLPFNADGVRANTTANDGTEPTTESGSVVGVANGKFGDGAVSIVDGFTNHILNPSFEVDTSDWVHGGTGTGGTIARSTTYSYIGSASLAITMSDGTGSYAFNLNYTTFTIADGESISAQVMTYSSVAGAYGQLKIIDATPISGPWILRDSDTGTKINEWELLTAVWTNNTGADAKIQFRLMVSTANGAGTGDIIYFDAVQATKTSYQLPYRDYTMPGVSGSAGLTSVVSDGKLHYPTSVINPAEGTIMFWARLPFVVPNADLTDYARFFEIGITSSPITKNMIYASVDTNWSSLFFNYCNKDIVVQYSISMSLPTDTNYHLYTFTWQDGGTLKLYLDGVLQSSSATMTAFTSGFLSTDVLRIASSATANSAANGLEIVDFTVATSEYTAAQIAAIYNSGLALSAARIQRGIDARCAGAQVTRGFEDVSHTDMTLDFETIGASWRGEVRQFVNEVLSASGNLTLTNDGDTTTRDLVVTIYASGAATVTLSTNGFALTDSTAADGDVLVIDCAAHTVTLNGADDYTNVTFGSNTTADWLPLEPGENTLAVTLSGAEIEIVAQWFDAYR